MAMSLWPHTGDHVLVAMSWRRDMVLFSPALFKCHNMSCFFIDLLHSHIAILVVVADKQGITIHKMGPFVEALAHCCTVL